MEDPAVGNVVAINQVSKHDEERLPASIEEARKILQSIRTRHGFLAVEHLRELSRSTSGFQEAIREIQQDVREKTAMYTNSVADELYSEKSRFIYELLQNADDSKYGTTESEPRVNINLYQDRFVLETNERGFTIANVKAICDIGKSSKKASAEDSSIGEKGYGFKSVFPVAYRARIQSGLWSFHFEPHSGDDGLGKITPIDTEPDILPKGVTTRIELLLHQEPKPMFGYLVDALENMHETAILFLQKITRLQIKIHRGNKQLLCIDIKKGTADRPAVLDYVLSLTRNLTITQRGVMVSETTNAKLYHIFETTVQNMPNDKHRKHTNANGKKVYKRQAELKLAFPVESKSGKPAVDSDGEYLFAYLPVYRIPGLPFMIQADFVTSNSREIILGCDWNDELRTNVADIFCVAVQHFYKDDNLRYSWPQYLPVSVKSGPEKNLFRLIKAALKGNLALESWMNRTPTPFEQLMIVPTAYTHHGGYIVDDFEPETYLAPEYLLDGSELLQSIGMRLMTQDDFLLKLSHDIKSSHSALKRIPTSSPWHYTLSRTLIALFETPDNSNIRPAVMSLKLIPLRKTTCEGLDRVESAVTWVSGNEIRKSPVYLPESIIKAGPADVADRNTLPIPRGLGIQVADPDSVVSAFRRKLLVTLGVLECPPSKVVKAIHECHQDYLKKPNSMQILTLISHLQYLFWLGPDTSPISKPLMLLSEDNCVSDITSGFYLKSNREHDAWALLKDLPLAARKQLGRFIADPIATAEIDSVRRSGRSWMQWLQDIALVKRSPPLTERASLSNIESLSPILLRVLKDHPEKFIPTLQAHWVVDYQLQVQKNLPIRDALCKAKVSCEQNPPTALANTYMPTEQLKSEAKRMGLLNQIPFVKLPEMAGSEEKTKWKFLSDLDVRSQVNLDFYLKLLSITRRLEISQSFPAFDTATKLYSAIGTLCNRDQQLYVKEEITKCSGIYIPSNDKNDRWKQASACVWEAPNCISVRSALAKHYGMDSNISTLFRIFLCVGDVDSMDYLEQLRYCKRTRLNANGDPIRSSACAEIYRELHACPKVPQLWDHIREIMKAEKLVFMGGDWYSPSDCLWSTDTTISGKVSIGHVYGDDLRAFFVTKLQVKVLNTAMLVADLRKKATAKQPLKVGDAKKLIEKINSMLSTELLDENLQARFDELGSVRCFPVRSKGGNVVLKDASADFAIIDHERFREAFHPEADLFDYELYEVQGLRTFLEATKLTNRYLSDKVKEVSEIEGNVAKSQELTTQLQRLAYAIFCCAVHFKSTKVIGYDDSLYKSLSTVEIHGAAKMGTSMILEQNGRTIKIPSTRSQLKIDVHTTPWKVFVPNDVKARKACYTSQLPQAMLQLLGISGSGAAMAIYRFINEPFDEGVETAILEQFDVPRISWIAQTNPSIRPRSSTPRPSPRVWPNASTPVFGSSEVSNSLSHQADNTLSIPVSTPVSSFTAPTNLFGSGVSTPGNAALFSNSPPSGSHRTFVFGSSVRSERSGHSEVGTAAPVRHGREFSFHFPTATPDAITRHSVSATPDQHFNWGGAARPRYGHPVRTRSQLQKQKYRALLDKIIERVSGEDNTWNFGDLVNALPESNRIQALSDKDETFGVRSDGELAHNMKIGAAGELFVFEKMKTFDLPFFSRNNWLSTIRHEVKVHQKYTDMPDRSPDLPSGSRAEPADIVYEDPTGSFLDFLRGQDCVGVEDWLEAPRVPKRKYYIEVKTTTAKDCDTPFHMSKGQYSRMLKMRKKSWIQLEEVYIICRVYNLLSNNIAMRFYVSPGRDQEATNNGSELFVASGVPDAATTDAKPILNFTSKGFEVEPVK